MREATDCESVAAQKAFDKLLPPIINQDLARYTEVIQEEWDDKCKISGVRGPSTLRTQNVAIEDKQDIPPLETGPGLPNQGNNTGEGHPEFDVGPDETPQSSAGAV